MLVISDGARFLQVYTNQSRLDGNWDRTNRKKAGQGTKSVFDEVDKAWCISRHVLESLAKAAALAIWLRLDGPRRVAHKTPAGSIA